MDSVWEKKIEAVFQLELCLFLLLAFCSSLWFLGVSLEGVFLNEKGDLYEELYELPS